MTVSGGNMSPEEREEYRQRRAISKKIEEKVLDAIAEVVKGTPWEIENAILTEVLVVMNWVDDDQDHFAVWINTGSWTQAEGMARRVIRDVEFRENYTRTAPD